MIGVRGRCLSTCRHRVITTGGKISESEHRRCSFGAMRRHNDEHIGQRSAVKEKWPALAAYRSSTRLRPQGDCALTRMEPSFKESWRSNDRRALRSRPSLRVTTYHTPGFAIKKQPPEARVGSIPLGHASLPHGGCVNGTSRRLIAGQCRRQEREAFRWTQLWRSLLSFGVVAEQRGVDVAVIP
jgi:hypothetical protein